MSFPDEDRAGFNSIHWLQYRQCPFLKLESRGVPIQGEIVEAIRLAKSDIAELPVDRVGIGKRKTFPRHGDSHLLLGDGESNLQLDSALQIDSLYLRLEAVSDHFHRIRPVL